MTSFHEVLTALLPGCDASIDVFRVSSGGRELIAREGEGKAVLEVWDGERCASREYDYDNAYKVLAALRDGTATLKAWFPPVPGKMAVTGSIFGKIIGILLGSVLALGSAFCSFAVLMASLRYGSMSLLMDVALQVFFGGVFVAGIALVVTCARGTLTVKKFFGVGVSLVMCTTLLSLILGIWSTRADDPETPLHVYIALTIAFGIFVVIFAALVIYTLRTANGRTSAVSSQPIFRVEPSAQTIAPVIAAIKERTACEAIRIRLDFDRQPALSDSKLGGLPYWDTSVTYPCDEESEHELAMLAQINLSQLPQNDIFPSEGMLQFFIFPDMEYGISSTKKVVYHKTINRNVYEKQIREMKYPCSDNVSYGDFPVTGELAMDFEKVTTYMTPDDWRFDALLREIAGDMGVELFDGTSHSVVSEACDGDDFYKESSGHRMGGYPYFTQYDPRYMEELHKYDFLLLQIDTDDKVGISDKLVMWGDSGVGQFFINSEALREMKLDDVYYTWDCC